MKRDDVNPHARRMTSYLLCKAYSEDYTGRVSRSTLRWIANPGSLRFALITEEMGGDKGEELSAILKDLDKISDSLMRNKVVQLTEREDCLETLSNLSISGVYPNETISRYADMVLRCLITEDSH